MKVIKNLNSTTLSLKKNTVQKLPEKCKKLLLDLSLKNTTELPFFSTKFHSNLMKN